MSITIDAVPGSETANSYATLAEANEYMLAHAQFDMWDGLTDEQKKAALVRTTRFVDTFQLGGVKATSLQALEFPRTGIADRNGYAVTGVPTKLKNAICEIAMWKMSEDERLASDFELQNFSSVSIGPISYTVGDNIKSLPDEIAALLAAIGPGVVKGDGISADKPMRFRL